MVFAGDILFIGGTPIVWDGPVANWVAACDRILELAHGSDAGAGAGDPVIIPGHGPLAGADDVLAVRGYLVWLEDACRAAHDAGLTAADAVRELAGSDGFAPYREWGEWERLAVNVRAVYREFGATDGTIPDLFGAMAELLAG